MRVGLIAEKLGMSRFYDSLGVNQPATLLRADKCQIIDIRTDQKNGYNALRVSFGQSKKEKKVSKGFLKKNNLRGFKNSKEFRVENTDGYKIGDEINVEIFTVGQYVDVSSRSIGKGFAGGMKRHNFGGNRATHGVSISHRSHGSTGQCQDPGKVFKGKKMAGHLGNNNVTIQNLRILKIDKEKNLILVKGAVPGHKGSIINIVDSIKKELPKSHNLAEKTLKSDDDSSQNSQTKNLADENKVINTESNEPKTEIKKEAQPTPVKNEDNNNTEKKNESSNEDEKK